MARKFLPQIATGNDLREGDVVECFEVEMVPG